MRNLYKGITALILYCCALPVFSQTATYNELFWNDEFEGEGAPDPTFWSYDLGTGQGGWGNNEVQYYTNQSSNIRRSNGKLVIEANKVNSSWSSARIKTQGKVNFTYGRIEFKAKLPKGSGTWPALWLLGENITTKGWPACGEIDVMEHVGRDPGKIHATLHTPSSNGNSQNTNTIIVSDYADNFHVYAAEWSPESIKFYVDNTLFYTYAPVNKDAATWPFNDPQFIIINLAMGGNFASDSKYESNGQKNGIDPALTSARFEVDYVRVYQTFKDLKLSGPTTVSQNAQNLTFKASKVEGASYTWKLPAGASIVSGANTSEIKANWGTVGGIVQVQMVLNNQTYQKDILVSATQNPEGESFLIEDFNIVPSTKLSSSGGEFQLSDSNGALQVDYTISNPNSLPQILYTLTEPLNLSGYPVLAVTLKTKNKSGRVVLRIDLKDTEGNTTGTNKVFTLTPLIDDGEFYTYYFDYSTLFGNASGQIDGTKVKQIRVLVNYGILGSPGTDTFWIDQFNVLKSLPLKPNRPSHLTLTKTANSVTLRWRNNSTNEESIKVLRGRSQNGTFSEVVSLPPNTTDYTDAVNPEDGYVYKLQTQNGAGISSFSNQVTSISEALSIKPYFDNERVKIYPNPNKGNFNMKVPNALTIKSTQLYDALGKRVPATTSLVNSSEFQVKTEALPGIYFYHLFTQNGLIIKRVLII